MWRFLFLTLGWLFLTFGATPSIIRANETIFSDDFNRSSFGNWQIVQNTGSNYRNICLDASGPALWKIVSGWMRLVVDGASCTLAITPTDFFFPPGTDHSLEFDWRLDESSAMDRNFVWLWQDENNWYDLKLYGTGLDLQKMITGVAVNDANRHLTFPFVAGQTYHFLLQKTGHHFEVWIDGVLVLRFTDTAPFLSDNNLTLALKTSVGGTSRSVSAFDNLVVKNLGKSQVETLAVPLFKQTNPIWKDLKYDSAENWSDQPTIGRWGCALTSMVMVLHYYNISHLPNGILLTPLSLNEWLLSQVDGYLGEGLVNWQAVSRLTGLIGAVFGTPKLEYSYVHGDSLTRTIAQLKNSRPTILNLPGHFVVSTGFNQEETDLEINDPAYNFTHLSQHKVAPISSRVFTPSFTDLSYLLVVSDPETEVNFLDENGVILPGQEQHLEELNKTIMITQVAKPGSGHYLLQLKNSTASAKSPQLFVYDQSGTITLEKTFAPNPETATTVKIDYYKNEGPDEQTKIITQSSWEDFSQEIEILKQRDQFSDQRIYQYLTKIVSTALAATPADGERYRQLLLSFLNQLGVEQTPVGRLRDLLNLLTTVI